MVWIVTKWRHHFERSIFRENVIFKILLHATLKPLVSLFGCLIACSGSKGGNTHTYRHRLSNHNPCCACLLRVTILPTPTAWLRHTMIKLHNWSSIITAISRAGTCSKILHQKLEACLQEWTRYSTTSTQSAHSVSESLVSQRDGADTQFATSWTLKF